MKKSISLYWWNKRVPNFGDDCSPHVVSHILGCGIVPGDKYSADMVAVGSVASTTLFKEFPAHLWTRAWVRSKAAINRVRRRAIAVWGSGFMLPPPKGLRVTFFRRPAVFAVRGPKTLEVLRELGAVTTNYMKNVALGDPGVFMNELSIWMRTHEHRRAFIPHASYWNDGRAAAFSREHPDIWLIDPRRNTPEVVADIATCEEVFSCSLHGLIAADALGIPNRWVELETPSMNATESRFKFDDYYAAFGIKRNPCRLCEVVGFAPFDPINEDSIASVKKGLREAGRAAVRYVQGEPAHECTL